MNLQNQIPLDYIVVLSTVLFFVGLLGVLIRRNLITMLMGVELMLNAVNINFVAFNRYLFPDQLEGHFFALIVMAIAAGAAAYLLKQTAATDLVKAIREVRKGNAYFSPAIAKRLSEQSLKPASETKAMVDLTSREAEVLQLIAKGLSNHEISERLFLALSTVKGHNQKIFDKLQVQRRTEAIARARELGLL